MEIRLTLQHGPLDIEIEGDTNDDYEEEFLNLLEFLEEHEEQLIDLQQGSQQHSADAESEQVTVTAGWGSSSDEGGSSVADSAGNETATQETADDSISDFANQLNVDADQLMEVIDIDPNGEELPFIIADTDDFGDSRRERQFRAALILLATWQECYEENRMNSSDLKDSLEYSGIDSDGLHNMYQVENADSYFDRQGRGPNATVALSRPGKREARTQIQTLLE